MKKFTLIMLLMSLFTGIIAQTNTLELGGDDITVNPVANRIYSSARVSTAYDGTIYVGRMYKTSAMAPITNIEVFKSIDKGVTFSLFTSKTSAANTEFKAFDMIAAGNNSTDFKLFIAYSHNLINSGGSNTLLLESFNQSATLTPIPLSGSYYAPAGRGFMSISLATDSRDKSADASPYTISLAVSKSGISDSIIAWSDNVGGALMYRRGVYTTPKYLKKVSCAIGSNINTIYGRLGIAWDEFEEGPDTLGNIYVADLYADDATFTAHGSPNQLSSLPIYRNPSIALSQHTAAGSGPGSADIRTIIFYEKKDPAGIEGMNIHSYVNDQNINLSPMYSIGPLINGNGNQINPHVVYDARTSHFLFTYYDDVENSLVYMKKMLAGGATEFSMPEENYREANTPMRSPFPRIDAGSENNNAVFVWNDMDTTKFDAEISYVSIQETAMNIKSLVLYPNPAQNITTLKFTTESNDNVTLRVMDMTGKTMYSKQNITHSGENLLPVDVSGLAPGHYLLCVQGENTNGTIAFIIAR